MYLASLVQKSDLDLSDRLNSSHAAYESLGGLRCYSACPLAGATFANAAQTGTSPLLLLIPE
jgi:hypothetical protein